MRALAISQPAARCLLLGSLGRRSSRANTLDDVSSLPRRRDTLAADMQARSAGATRLLQNGGFLLHVFFHARQLV